MYFGKKTHVFHCGNLGKIFRDQPSSRHDGSHKNLFYKVVEAREKKDGNYGQFVQLMCDHWHITDFTAQFANELEEAKS
jgi:hypothetical protein